MDIKVISVRILVLAAFACGVIGLVAGLADKMWKLGATGWFTGGSLLAVLAIAVILCSDYESKNSG